MNYTITTPFLGTNDSQAVVLNWAKASGAVVRRDEVICELETTKAVLDVSSVSSGYLHIIVPTGDTVQVGQVLAVVSEDPAFDLDRFLSERQSVAPKGMTVTKKAEMLMARYSIDADKIRTETGTNSITEETVRRYIDRKSAMHGRVGVGKGQRVGIIGGVGGGGALIVIDALSRMRGLHAAGIFDRDPQFAGKTVLGVSVVGSLEALYTEFEAGRIDAVVIAFNRDLTERERVFEEIKSKGVPFVNVIDPTAELRGDVTVGTGNVILGRVYVGACSIIGDNNFISANVSLEHGNALGSSCAFGPGVFTSGNVTIGNRVRFGTGIFIEPGLTIGDDATVGSGQTIVTDVRPNITLTTRAKS